MKSSASRDRAVMICIDDDPQLLETLEFLLGKNFPGYRIVACVSGQDAIEQIQECKVSGRDVHLVISDQVMEDVSGIEVLSRVPDIYPDAVRIILTGQAGLQSAVEAIKLGINDYLEKPISELELVKTIRNHLNTYLLKLDNRRLQEFVKQSHLRTSEITDLAFRTFNHHLTRLLTNEGDRRDVVESIRKARENISLLAQLYRINQAMVKGAAFALLPVRDLLEEAHLYVRGRGVPGILVEKRQEVRVEGPDVGQKVMGNRAVIRVVLERILDNACRYSPEDATIMVQVRGPSALSAGDRQSLALPPDLVELLRRQYLILSVTDGGTPGPEDFQNLLYVQDWQQPSEQEAPALKGLGLVIAQEYLLIMGGHLFIDAKVGHKGTTVHVAIPMDARGRDT